MWPFAIKSFKTNDLLLHEDTYAIIMRLRFRDRRSKAILFSVNVDIQIFILLYFNRLIFAEISVDHFGHVDLTVTQAHLRLSLALQLTVLQMSHCCGADGP